MTMSSVAQRMDEVRESRHLDWRDLQEFIEEQSGQSFGTFQRLYGWLTGRTPTDQMEFVAAFCRAFDVHPVWLLYGEGPRHWHLPDQRKATIEIVANWLEETARQLRGETTPPRSVDEAD